MKNISLFSLLAILISFTFVFSAQAELTEENKTELLGEIEAYLDTSNLIIVDGKEITIKEKGNYYAVNVPPVYSTGVEGEKLLIGGMNMNATPNDDPNIWNMTLTINNPVKFVTKKGTEIFSLNLGNQFFKGLWDTRIHSFVKIKAKYADTAISFAEGKSSMLIAHMSATQDGTVNNDSQLTAQSLITAQKITIQEDNRTTATIRKLNMTSNVQGLDFDKVRIFSKEISEIGTTATPGKPSPEDTERTLNALGALTSSIDGMDGSFNANGITVYPSPKENGQSQEPLKIETARFGIRLNDLRQDKIQFGLSFGYETHPFDSSVSAIDNIDSSLVPHKVGIDIDFLNLPAQKIFEKNPDLLQGSQANPMMAMMTMPQTLAEAGSSFKIEKIYFAGKDYTAQLHGSALASQDSPFGATADFEAKIEGLDKIMKSFKSRQGSLSPMETKIMQTLTMLQLMGQKQGNSDIRSYDLKLDDTGSFTINGADMSALTGMSAPQ